MLNEQSLFRKYKTQETKKKHAEEDKRIYYEVVKLLNKLEGGDLLLDKSPPKEGNEQQSIYDKIINDKSASAITITYNQLLRDSFDEKQLRQHLINTIHTLSFNKDIPIEIYLIPDMDTGGNFHYHGVVITPIKHRALFKRNITKYVGFMKFDYISDIEGWKNYCYKKPPKYTPVYTQEEIDKLDIYIYMNPSPLK